MMQLKINELGNQIFPIPIQIWNCIENVWLRKEILLNSYKSQYFTQPLISPSDTSAKYWVFSLNSSYFEKSFLEFGIGCKQG